MSRFDDLLKYGVACAFIGACLGMDDVGQALLFAFGFSFGLLLRAPFLRRALK